MSDKDDGNMNSFSSGATRDTSEGKLVYDKFLSPVVLKQFAKYMNMNRVQSDGKLRDGDNWQKGIPVEKYMESLYRHFFDVWFEHRGYPTEAGIMAALCGILFNTMGYMHEILKHDPDRDMSDFDGDEPTPEMKERLDKNSVSIQPMPKPCCHGPIDYPEQPLEPLEEHDHRHGKAPVEDLCVYDECVECTYGICGKNMSCPGFRREAMELEKMHLAVFGKPRPFTLKNPKY